MLQPVLENPFVKQVAQHGANLANGLQPLLDNPFVKQAVQHGANFVDNLINMGRQLNLKPAGVIFK